MNQGVMIQNIMEPSTLKKFNRVGWQPHAQPVAFLGSYRYQKSLNERFRDLTKSEDFAFELTPHADVHCVTTT